MYISSATVNLMTAINKLQPSSSSILCLRRDRA